MIFGKFLYFLYVLCSDPRHLISCWECLKMKSFLS